MDGIRDKFSKIVHGFRSIPYLFIGSGLSRRYLKTPGWEELIRNLSYLIDPKLFNRESEKEKYRGRGRQELLLDVAGLLYDKYREEYDKNEQFLTSEIGNYPIVSDKPILKQYIASLFSDRYFSQQIPESHREELKLLKSLGKRSVAAVITTNYDFLTRIVFPDFKEYVGQDDMLFAPLMGVQEVYKIHGCASKAESIVITRNDYERFDEKQLYLAAKLLTIFIEHPVVFLGYSIADVNIRKILASIAFCLDERQVEYIKNNLLFVEYSASAHSVPSINEMELSFDIQGKTKCLKMIKVSLNDFRPLFEALGRKTFTYNPRLLAQLKRDIYTVVSKNAPTATFVLPDEKTTQENMLNGVTLMPVTKAMEYRGFSRLSPKDIYEGLFSENELKYSRQKELLEGISDVCEQQLKPAFVESSNYLPLCFYFQHYHKAGGNLSKLDDNLVRYVRELHAGDFVAKSIPEEYRKLSTWEEIEDKIRARGYKSHHVRALYLISPALVDTERLRKFLLELINHFYGKENKLTTEVRQLIRYYDFLVYKNELPDL